MKKKELNQAIKKLYKYAKNDNIDFEYLNKEYKRLHDMDKQTEYLNINSLRMLIDLNRRFNIVPHHRFLIYIDETIK